MGRQQTSEQSLCSDWAVQLPRAVANKGEDQDQWQKQTERLRMLECENINGMAPKRQERLV